MREIIQKILQVAVHAPSGDNSQPWRFAVEDSKIYLYNLPEKDNPILNFEQRGSYIAHGGLIENICLLSKSQGLKPSVALFPHDSDPTLVAVISLEQSDLQADELWQYIPLRHTNRKVYDNKPLTTQQREELLCTPNDFTAPKTARVVLLEAHDEKGLAAKAGSSLEQVILENRELHHLMFKDVLWTEKQNRTKISGLYIRTMEFAPPVKFVFWLASFWPVVNILNKAGLAKFVARQDAALYGSGAVIAAIIMPGGSKEDFIYAGRIMQRLWLKTTKMNLNLQPVAAALFAGRRIEAGETAGFSFKHLKIIQENFTILKKLFKLRQDEVAAMMFRIGQAKPPSGHSLRKEPNIIWNNTTTL